MKKTFSKLLIIALLLSAISLVVFGCTGKPIVYKATFYVEGEVYSTKDIDDLFTMPNDPTKDSYTFDGWYFDKEFTNKFEISKLLGISKNVNVYAKFTEEVIPSGDFKYTVEYYLENVDNDEYTLLEDETEELFGCVSTNVSAEIKTFEHFTPESDNVSGKITADGSLVLKVYYQRDEYKVTFDGNGGTYVGDGAETQYIKYQGSAVAPTYQMDGLTLGFDNSLKNITKPITISAVWFEVDNTKGLVKWNSSILCKVEYSFGDDYITYGQEKSSVSVTDILKSLSTKTLKSYDGKNMNLKLTTMHEEGEGTEILVNSVLGLGMKLRTVTTLAELKEVGNATDYVVLANDIVLDNAAVQQAIVYSTAGVDEVPNDESCYYIGRRLFNGTLNGLGHTIAYTLDDTDNLRTDKDVRTSAAGQGGAVGEHAYGWAGIWEKVENATLMNLKIDANITKPHSQDPYYHNMEWWTSVYAARTISSTVYNCDFVGEYYVTNRLDTSKKNYRFGLGAWECASFYLDCIFDFRVYEGVGREAVQANNETAHSCGVLKWSIPSDLTFFDCSYYVNVDVSASFNPFANGTNSFATNCNVVYKD